MAATTKAWTTTLLDVLFDDASVGRCLVAPDGTVLRANPEWLRSTGFTAEQAIGAEIVALFPDARDLTLAVHARARAGHTVQVPRHAQRIGGRETWWEGRIAPVPMDGGTGLLITARELTGAPARAQPAETRALAGAPADRELLEAAVEHSKTCLAVLTGRELRYALVNPAYQAIAPGRPMLGQTYEEVFPEAAAAGSRERLLRVLDTGEPWEVDRWRAPLPGNPDATWQGRVVRLPARRGEPPSALVVIDDVTADARADEALREEKEKYRSLFEYSLDAVYLTLRDGTILDANRAACELHGMTLDELKRAGRSGLVVNDARHAAALGARAADGHVRAEMTVRRKDGTPVPVEVHSVLLDPRRPDSPAFVISRDVSDRQRREGAVRRALEEARESEDRFRAVFESANDAVLLSDPSGAGRILMANPAACRLFGWTAEEFRSVDRARMLDVTDPGVAAFLAARSRGEDVGPAELTYLRKDGTRFTGEITSAMFQDRAGETRAVAMVRDVTERRRSADAVALSEAILAQAGAMARLGAWWIDATYDPEHLDRNPLRWSAEVYRIFGYEPGEVPVTNALFFRHVHPDDRERVSQAVARAIAARERYVVEHRIVRRDGEERVVLEHGDAHHDEAGRLVRLVGAVQDVTDRKRAEDAAGEREDRYRTLFTNMTEGFALGEAICDDAGVPRDFRLMEMNDAFERQSGLSRARAAGRPIREVLPNIEPSWIDTYCGVALGGEPRRFESYNRDLDRHFSVYCFSPARGRFAILFTDVTDRWRAEAALRENEEKFRAVFERAAIGIGRVRFQDARWIDVNEAFCRMLGRPMDEMLRTPWPEITHPDDLDLDLVPFRRMAAGELEAYTVEKRFLHADGHHVWAKLTLSLVRDPQGRPDYEIAIIEDVGHRKRAERALRESQERLQEYADLLEHAPVLVRDADDRIVVWNLGMERLYGWPRQAALGRISHELLGTRFPEPVPAIHAALERTGSWEGELRHRRADGAEIVVASRWLLHRDAAGGRRAIVEVSSDVTGLRRAEAALREANERLREADRRKDEFLGMLSHELRNPLAPIRNSLWLLDRAEPTGPQARRAKEVANRQVAHLTRLVDDLLDVTRIARGKIELRRSDLDLAALARRTADDYRALMQERGLDLAVEAPRAPLLVNGDETRLAQVLGNLLSNAAKFTPSGGRVTLSVASRDGRALVHVRDTGPGIAPEVLPIIFEPVTQAKQTLARSEGGLGLGLAFVKGLVALHGGEVTVSTGGEAGSDFVVTLPLADRRPHAAGTARP